MKKIVSLLVFCSCFFVAQAQDSAHYPLANKYRAMAQKAFDEGSYDTACRYARLHLDIELALDSPRN
jgi:hypothetical protein